MGWLKSDDTVYSSYSTKRWLKNYFENHKSVNLAGLIQEAQMEYIRKNSPDYFNKFMGKKVNFVENQNEIKNNIEKQKPQTEKLNLKIINK